MSFNEIDLYPYVVLWFQLGAILLFLVIVFYLPRFMRWLNEIEKERKDET